MSEANGTGIIGDKWRVEGQNGEALARLDAQREKLVSQLSELETTERVLARYSTGTRARKTSSAKMPTTGAKAAPPSSLPSGALSGA